MYIFSYFCIGNSSKRLNTINFFMDAFSDLTSSELIYLIDLLNSRVLSLQETSFLSTPERDLIESIVLKFGWSYEFFNSRFYIVPNLKSVSNE